MDTFVNLKGNELWRLEGYLGFFYADVYESIFRPSSNLPLPPLVIHLERKERISIFIPPLRVKKEVMCMKISHLSFPHFISILE